MTGKLLRAIQEANKLPINQRALAFLEQEKEPVADYIMHCLQMTSKLVREDRIFPQNQEYLERQLYKMMERDPEVVFGLLELTEAPIDMAVMTSEQIADEILTRLEAWIIDHDPEGYLLIAG